jgi:hypothetical protein
MTVKSFKTAGLAIASVAVGLTASAPAQAFSIFFGEDQNANIGANPLTNSNSARNNFFSNLSGSGTETFESFATGTTAAPTPIVVNFPGIGNATLSGQGSVISGSNSVGRFPISGTQSYEVSGNGYTIDFATPVAAFGFYGTDIGDFNGQITLTLNDTNNTVLTVPNTLNGVNGSGLYYGFIAQNAGETFTRLTFGNTASGTDVFGFDDLTVGNLSQVSNPTTAVPEPFTVIGSIIGGTAAFRMKKKLKSSK